MRLRQACAIGLLVILGCSSGPAFAPVSGVVTLNGKPYPKGVITFQPISDGKNTNPGKGSSAYTDENGRFVLIGTDGEKGAIVGKHLVRIMTKGNDVSGAPDTGSDDKVVTASKNEIPLEWNANSDKTFDVPARGTDQANFDIVTGKKK
jgi:hypothetical protein